MWICPYISILIMHYNIHITLRLIAIAIMLSLWHPTVSAQSVQCENELDDNETYVEDSRNDNIIKKVINYFESTNKEVITNKPKFSFIGGPHYSSDTKFGIGLLSAGLYSTDPANVSLEPSNVTLFADITTAGYFKIGVEGLHLYKRNQRRIDYELSFNSYSTYYWGIGTDKALREENKSKYLLLDVCLKIDHLWEVKDNLFAGPQLKLDYTAAHKIRNAAMWNNQPQKASAIMIGAKVQYDSRDNYTSPSVGWLGDVSFGWNKGLNSNYRGDFTSIEAKLCNYSSIWKEGVLASRAHGHFTFGNTPWCYMPVLGASGTMRGYYEGQYRDKQEFDVTFELRQHLFRRCGMVVWGGIGSVFPSLSGFRARYILPTYGIGYRWEFKKKTNVRVDVGFGKKCWGVDFNIGEAF